MKFLTVAMLLGAMGYGTDASAAEGKAAGLKGNPGQFFGTDDYPADAIRAGEQGRVITKLWIDITGKVISCTVTESSGSTSLDQTTCKIALEKVSFTPATDRKGRPIAATYTLPVRWVLPTGEQTFAPADTIIEMTVSLSDSGEVLACNHTAAPALSARMDPCAEFPVGRTSMIRWKRGDRPVGGTMVRTFKQRVTLDP